MSEVQLSAAGRPDVCVSAHGWVNKLNSPRVFFEGAGLLPSQTPTGLKDLRQQELDIIKVRLPGAALGSSESWQTIGLPPNHSARLETHIFELVGPGRCKCQALNLPHSVVVACSAGSPHLERQQSDVSVSRAWELEQLLSMHLNVCNAAVRILTLLDPPLPGRRQPAAR